MNKKVILVFATVGSILGAYIPFLFGETDIFSGWGIVLGLVGGLAGIWLGVWATKRFE